MKHPTSSVGSARSLSVLRGFVFLAVSIFVLGMVAKTVIHLPGVPYNVAEMFAGEPSWNALVRFALTLLSIGMGAHFAAYLAALRRSSALILPLCCVLAVVTTYLIGQRAISRESWDDFTGAQVLYRDIVESHVWGDRAARMVAQINGDLFAFVERMVRFVCLVTPLVLWLAIFDVTFAQPRLVGQLRVFALHVLMAAPWLALFKYVAIDQANTDNLVELIEPGSGMFLYGLLVLMALVAATVASMGRFDATGKVTTIVAFVAAIPLGWYLLNQGLVHNLQKYGVTFSGVDFFLGPDREHKLSRTILFVRWSVLQAAAEAGLAWSMIIAGCLVPAINSSQPRRK